MQAFKAFKQLDSISDLELSFYEEVSEIPENEGDFETTVSYVKDTRDGKLYIKKEIKNGDKAVFEELLRYEERNGKKLEGVPGIATITDDRNTVYVIEEFINCPTLHSVMETQSVTAEELTLIFREVCIVLERLHKSAKPITHGDISTKNILVDMDAVRGKTKDQKVYIVDFNRGDKHTLRADILPDMKKCCKALRECMDTLVLKSITEFDGEFWETLKDIAENGYVKYTTDRQMIADLGRLIGKRAPRTEKSKKKSYTLPGFRTKSVWKAMIACIGYLLMFVLACFMNFEYEGAWLLYEKVCFFFMLFTYVSWFSNYMGVRDKYSWMTGKNVVKKFIGHFVAVVAIFGFWMMMIVGPDLLHIA
ncbi:MAG: hypothetical protein E7263_01815 [Lachnospiraceae bacterium]|nr:hypothetical protein [Lachnospiraceae bacterium]